MIDKIEKLARDLRADYGLMADKALDKIRTTTLDTADLVAKTKQPVRKIADTGIKLNRISHKGFEKLVKAQARFFEATIDDGSREAEGYTAPGYRPVNEPMIVQEPGTVMNDPNRWQPLALALVFALPAGAGTADDLDR